NSNTQFGVLGLWACARGGIPIKPATWARVREFFRTSQNADGTWGYHVKTGGTPNMTMAGVASLLISSGQMRRPAVPCGAILVDRSIAAGMRALEQFSGRLARDPDDPIAAARRDQNALLGTLYGMYALERVGMLSNQSVVAGIDWYREGSEILVRRQ